MSKESIVGVVNVEQVDGTKVEKRPIGRMSDDDLKAFVLGCVEKRIVTSLHLQAAARSEAVSDDTVEAVYGDLLRRVFLPTALGGLQHVDLDQLALIWEWSSEAGPRTINGHPQFMSMRLLHKADWERARPAIVAELERRKGLVVP